MCTLSSPLTGVMSTAVRSPVNVARHALWYLRYHSAQPKREHS
jgi:hypothetical protein